MIGTRLYFIQRLTAVIMAPLVIGHLATLIYAIQGGLSAEEILSRTQGSLFWGIFYFLFVIAVSLHAAIGLRVIAAEWLKLSGIWINIFTSTIALLFFSLGSRAVYSVLMG